MKAEQVSPLWSLIVILTLIFCVEQALMYSLDYFLPQTISVPARALINAATLTLAVAPFIWWLILRVKLAQTNEAPLEKKAADTPAVARVQSENRGAAEPVTPVAVTMPHHAANAATGEHGVPFGDTQRKAAEERIRRLSTHDGVTGLADAQNFYHCLDQDISAAERDHKELALAFLSLDTFRNANAALGQRAGDRILATVGERIRYQARRSDMVAQLADDEFAVIMANGAGRQNAVNFSDRIIDALSKPYFLDGQRQAVQINISIGIAVFPADGKDAESLVRAVHAEIEKAK